MAKCKAVNSKGEACGAWAGKDAEYCFMHEPTRGKERAEARRKGGSRVRPGHGAEASILPARVRSLEDALTLMDYVLREALPLENSISRGRLLVAIANAFIEAIKTGELENRILALEMALKPREGEK